MKGPLGLLHACIGTPVTGNPTQYMIEQAFHHQTLPHRYLTFDIPADRFAEHDGGSQGPRVQRLEHHKPL